MIEGLIREYVRALLESSPIAYDDTLGMVNFTHPTIDPDCVEDEFYHDAFIMMAKRIYKDAKVADNDVDIDKLAEKLARRYRRLMGVDVDIKDLKTALGRAEKEEEEFLEFTPEEQGRYYADPKSYTRDF